MWGKSYEERYKTWDKEGKMTRPSVDEIEIFKKFIGPLSKNQNILIFGPTPELRDIVAGYPVTVADISRNIIASGAKYLKKANTRDETWIERDWLSLPFPDNHFDIILGDLVLNQFSPGEEEKKFLRRIHSLCSLKGRFVSRFMFAGLESRPEMLRRKVSFLCSVSSFSWKEKVFAVANTAVVCTADHSCRIGNLYFAYTLLRELSKSSNLSLIERMICKEAEMYLKKNGFVGARWWTPPMEKDLLTLLSTYFTIIGREHSKSHPAQRHPILNCVPKKI